MKKLVFIFTLLLSTGLFFACEEIEKVTIDLAGDTTAPQLVSPATGPVTLSMANQNQMVIFRWRATQYPGNLAAPRYVLQMDRQGNNFANPRVLANITDTVFQITQAALNARLIDMGITAGAVANVQFRVLSYITDADTQTFVFSAPLNLAITTYIMEIIVKPIFMLGGGTTAGWSADAALQMSHIGAGRFAVVDQLTPGQWAIKFISVRGSWQPQWGAGPGSTATAGTLVLQRTGGDPEPPPIDTRELPGAGHYRVVADTALLTYTIERVTEQLFLLGGATTVGWDNANALPLTRVSPGIFRITTPLTAGGQIKFIETLGQWQPQWGTNAQGTATGGALLRNPPGPGDPDGIPSPAVAGTYTIEVNLHTMRYRIFQP
ncbi:MAG TPA: hypothetical protein DCM62_03800 [Bacteroidales bacterium]|nr:hypothetical protein [Bacteroidales bacterium]